MVPFAPGEVVAGRFEIVRRLGAGGLAEVLLARDGLSGTEVALKVLHLHLAEDPALAARFRREMSITRALDHAGIVRVFDLHQHAGRPFFSMEFLRGRTLADRLREGPLPAPEARRIARVICAALQSAHRAGVIHRDLKPQNVFLLEGGAVKIVDFGLARVEGQARLTAQSAVMGTPGYIAPELYAGERPDARADVYSVGATFLEMLGGHRGAANSDPYAAARAAPDFASLPLAAEDVAVLRRALDDDPEQRFCDAGQMLKALGGERVPPPPNTPPPMTSGDYQVEVHTAFRPLDVLRGREPIDRVLDRLGSRPRRGWKWRLAGAGRAVLVSGASRRTAEAAAAICADHGVPATVSRQKRRSEFFARHGAWLLTLGGLAIGFGAAEVMDGPRLAWTLAAAIAGYVLSWGLPPLAAHAPLSGLPRRESGMSRLADGVHRRAERLKLRGETLPEAHQQLVSELLRAADDASALALQFSREDEQVAPAGVTPLPSAALRSLETLTGRLLEIATALDDALVVAEDPAALQRLQAEVAAVQQAMSAPARAET